MRRQTIPPLLLLGGVLSLVMISCSLIPSSLLAPTPILTPRIRGFELEELLIDVSAFSSRWRLDGPAAEEPDEMKPAGAKEDLYVQFSSNNPTARINHAVYRFHDSRAAASGYRNLPGWFYNANRITPYEAPDWMQYQSPVADQFRFACADFYGGYPEVHSKRCVAIGQYQEYISAFSISVSPPEGMADHLILLEQILKAIDERMALYLTD